MLHEEGNGVATLPATKTFEDFLGRGNSKRWRFLIMKRTKTKVIRPSFLQPDKSPDNFKDINA